MPTFTLEEITNITGGMLTKVQDATISQIAPPLLSDANTLALALGEEEIANLSKSSAKAALVPLGVQIPNLTTIEVERPRLAMMKYGIKDIRDLNSGNLSSLAQFKDDEQ